MQVMVNIPDELAAQVAARGFALETYVRGLMEEKLSQGTSSEWSAAAGGRGDARICERHGTTLGGLDLKSMVHEGHKY